MGVRSFKGAVYVNKIRKLPNMQVQCNANMVTGYSTFTLNVFGTPLSGAIQSLGPLGQDALLIVGHGRVGRLRRLTSVRRRICHILEIAKNVLVFTIGVW